jgi:hypothetical protein
MKPKYTSKTDEERNETFYFRDGVEIDPAEEESEETEDVVE